MLHQGNRNFSPNLYEARQKIRPFQLQVFSHAHGEDNFFRVRQIVLNEMCVWQTEKGLIATDVPHAKPKETKDVRPTVTINDAQAVKLVNARRVGPVLDVVEPTARDEIVAAFFLFGELEASRFHISKRQTDAESQSLQSCSR